MLLRALSCLSLLFFFGLGDRVGEGDRLPDADRDRDLECEAERLPDRERPRGDFPAPLAGDPTDLGLIEPSLSEY